MLSCIFWIRKSSHAPRERVSWNGSEWLRRCWTACHAPRERVSWNMKYKAVASAVKVTLHVSVWVEMVYLTLKKSVLLSRSTWACELKLTCHSISTQTSTSRSTWACELKSKICLPISTTFSSRSTWACELKLLLVFPTVAPCTSRSTWACELKYAIKSKNI